MSKDRSHANKAVVSQRRDDAMAEYSQPLTVEEHTRLRLEREARERDELKRIREEAEEHSRLLRRITPKPKVDGDTGGTQLEHEQGKGKGL